MSSNPEQEDKNTVCKYLTYAYKRRDGSSKTIRLPLVNVFLKSPTTDTETIALLDSGATDTILPLEYAEILSLEFLKDKNGNLIKSDTVGAGGTFHSLRAILQKLCLKKRTKLFCTLSNIPVLIPEIGGMIPYMILGRDYVFNRFDITFHERRQKITFTRI